MIDHQHTKPTTSRPAKRVLELYREPARMPDEPYGFNYRSVTRLTEHETFSPLAAPRSSVKVADCLPGPAPAASA